MPSPLPGMDPYLESPRYWSDFHGRFITYACEALQLQLPTRYRARIGEWLVLEATQRIMIPDVTIVRRPTERSPGAGTMVLDADQPVVLRVFADDLRQQAVEIVDRAGKHVVTAVELLSPVNKAPGEGKKRYLDKQKQVVESGTSLVELDLLHQGDHVLTVPSINAGLQAPYHSLICVWRSWQPLDCEVYPVRLQTRLPRVRIPLTPDDADVVLDMQAVFNRCYDAARYDLDLDYRSVPPIALDPPDAAWVSQHLCPAGE